MAASKSRYWRSLVLMVLLIAGLWGASLAVHAAEVGGAPEGEPRPALVNLGLDLQGGISVVLSPVGEDEIDAGSLEKAR